MKKLLGLNLGTMKFREEYDQACKDLGVDSAVIRARNSCFILDNGNISLFHKNVELTPTDYGYVYVRVCGRYALMTSLIMKFFKTRDVPICDDVYLEHTKNNEKITQMLLLSLARVAIPQTILFTLHGFEENKETILERTSFPCVLKVNGSRGRHVWKIENLERLESVLANIEDHHEVAMLQEFVPNTYDIRAIYLYGDVIGAIKRSSSDGFLNNVSQGSVSETIELTDEEIDLAKRACRVLGRTFAGVDIVRTPDGPKLFEVNLGPQIHGFEAATGIDVPKELVKRIKSTL